MMAEQVDLLKRAKKETAKIAATLAIMLSCVSIFIATWNRIELSRRFELYPRLIELIEIHERDKLVTRKDIEELYEANGWKVPE